MGGTLMSVLPAPLRVTVEPEGTVCGDPALETGGWIRVIPVELARAGGAVITGQGFSWPNVPTDAPVADWNGTYGPEPLTRNGNSWKVSGICRLPRTRFSGKINPNCGAV